eukprot:14551868-Alexandrium_andersonii.AAC.1
MVCSPLRWAPRARPCVEHPGLEGQAGRQDPRGFAGCSPPLAALRVLAFARHLPARLQGAWAG